MPTPPMPTSPMPTSPMPTPPMPTPPMCPGPRPPSTDLEPARDADVAAVELGGVVEAERVEVGLAVPRQQLVAHLHAQLPPRVGRRDQ